MGNGPGEPSPVAANPTEHLRVIDLEHAISGDSQVELRT
jgi:hypothetical protein